MKKIYRNNLKNWEFDQEAPQNSLSEEATIAQRQGASENENFEGKPTPSKTNFPSCFGILACIVLLWSIGLNADQWPIPPTTISTSGQSATNVQVAINGSGNVVAVWLEGGIVKASSATVTGGWSGTISTLSASSAVSPVVQIDPNGLATALWVENGVVNTASLPLNGSWSSEIPLSGSSVSSAQLSIDAMGNLVAIWVEGGRIKSAIQLLGGSWSTPAFVSAVGATSPQVSISSNGTVVAVWQAPVSSVPVIYAATTTISGGTWNSPVAISTQTVNSVYPQVVVDDSGNATAVWFTYTLANNEYTSTLQFSILPSGGSWGTPATISATGSRNPADLMAQLQVASDGTVLAVWTDSYQGSLYSILYSVLSQGNWSTPASPTGANLLASAFATAIDGDANAALAYMYYDTPSNSVLVQIVNNDIMSLSKVFYPSWTLSDGGNNGFPAVGCLSLSGTLCMVVAWTNWNGTNTQIQALLAEFAVIQPASNLSVLRQQQNFGILVEQENLLTWQASPSSSIAIYTIFRNGIALSAVPSTTLTYTDQNRPLHETVVYGVAATNTSGGQSSTVTFTFSN